VADEVAQSRPGARVVQVQRVRGEPLAYHQPLAVRAEHEVHPVELGGGDRAPLAPGFGTQNPQRAGVEPHDDERAEVRARGDRVEPRRRVQPEQLAPARDRPHAQLAVGPGDQARAAARELNQRRRFRQARQRGPDAPAVRLAQDHVRPALRHARHHRAVRRHDEPGERERHRHALRLARVREPDANRTVFVPERDPAPARVAEPVPVATERHREFRAVQLRVHRLPRPLARPFGDRFQRRAGRRHVVHP
jgi:hypothetical protein